MRVPHDGGGAVLVRGPESRDARASVVRMQTLRDKVIAITGAGGPVTAIDEATFDRVFVSAALTGQGGRLLEIPIHPPG